MLYFVAVETSPGQRSYNGRGAHGSVQRLLLAVYLFRAFIYVASFENLVRVLQQQPRLK